MSRLRCFLLALAVAFAAPVEAGESRVAYGRYFLRGPLESFELDAGRAGSTTVELELGAGETLEVELAVPVLTEPRSGFPAPVVSEGALPDGAQVRFEGWDGPRAIRMRDAWRRVPRGLTARTRPPVAAQRPESRGFELALLAAAGLLGLGLRRRPVPALCVGLAAAAILLARGEPSAPGSTLAVHEGEVGADWIVVVGSWGSASLDEEQRDVPLLRVETSPPDAALRLRIDLSRGGAVTSVTGDTAVFVVRQLPVIDSSRWVAGHLLRPGQSVSGQSRAMSSSAELHEGATHEEREFEHQLDEEALRANVLGAWFRSAQGTWSTWSGGELQGAPPGWLASGLPQGVGVLLCQGIGGRFLRQTGLAAPPDWFGE